MVHTCGQYTVSGPLPERKARLVPQKYPRLAATAVTGDPLIGGELGYGATTPEAGLSSPVMDLEEVPDLVVNLLTHPMPEHHCRLLSHATCALIESPKLIIGQGGTLAKG